MRYLTAKASACDVATHIVGIHLFNETLNMTKLPGTEYPCNLTSPPISELELVRLYNIDSMTETDFLKYNYSELLNVASHDNQKQKSWLKIISKQIEVVPSKRTLLGALRK
jgi:hypothetical protein